IFNAASHQAAIVLGNKTVDMALQESLREIQRKILAPHLQKNEVESAIRLTIMAMISALEEWPSVSLTPKSSFSPYAFITGLKWLAIVGLLIAMFMLLKIISQRPHWQELPIVDEANFLENQRKSAEMAYWRSHLHIKNL